MSAQVYRLVHAEARQRARAAVAAANDGFIVTVRPPTRSKPQNNLLHALLTEISEERQWAGEWLDVTTWKRLMTAAWLRARGESVRILPAIDGHGFDVIFERTSELDTAAMNELIEYIQAWRAMH